MPNKDWQDFILDPVAYELMRRAWETEMQYTMALTNTRTPVDVMAFVEPISTLRYYVVRLVVAWTQNQPLPPFPNDVPTIDR